MPLDPSSTTAPEIEDVVAKLIRDKMYGGKNQVVIEPFNGTRPIGSYASVNFLYAYPEQSEVYEYEDRDDELWEILRGERYCRLRIIFVNAGAMQKAIECQNLFRSTNREFDLAPITGFGGIGKVEDAGKYFAAKNEERAVFTVDVYANMSAEYLSNNIEIVKGDIVRDGEALPYNLGGDSCKATFGPNRGKS